MTTTRLRSPAFRCYVSVAFIAIALGTFARVFAANRSSPPASPLHQLRIYEIFEHNKAAFHERFRDHAMRIMKRHDFDIVCIWETRTDDRTEFVYLLRWPDEATMKERWTRFLADEEWRAIKRETGAKHGALVGEIHEKVLRPTDYSPLQLR